MPWRSLGFQFGFVWDKLMSQTWPFWVSQWCFPSHCKVFHHNNFSYNHCLYFIYCSSVTHSCSLLSNVLLCFVLTYSGEVKPQFFFALAFSSYSILVYLCMSLSSLSVALHFPGGFLFVAVLWKVNPKIFLLFFFSCQRGWCLASPLCA